MKRYAQDLVVVRGGGDIATGVVQKLHRAGMRVAVVETAQPTAIRRTVSLCEAVYTGRAQVEDLSAQLVLHPSECHKVWEQGEIPVLVDPGCRALEYLCPDGLVDAVLAKCNLGTRPDLADIVIALGPGFCAPEDAHAVIETQRGHTLGSVLFEGSALPNTGTPGMIAGRGAERVLRAPCAGSVRHHKRIGDVVREKEVIFSVGGQAVTAPFAGVLRGLIREGLEVPAGLKLADIDPRTDIDWHSISDKARCIGGGVLEAYLCLRKQNEIWAKRSS